MNYMVRLTVLQLFNEPNQQSGQTVQVQTLTDDWIDRFG